MSFKVIRIKISDKPLFETKLSLDGILTSSMSENSIPAEMVIEYLNSEDDLTPFNVIPVSYKYYEGIIQKYGLSELISGVKLDAIFDAISEEIFIDEQFKKEAEKIAYSIVAQFEKDTLFNNYNSGKIREYIENKILDLKDKFKIQPK